MPFKKFDEYLDGKGNVNNPVVTINADYTGPQKKSPERSGDWVISGGKKSKEPGVGQGKLGDYQPTDKPWKPKNVPVGGIVEKGIKPAKYPKNTMGSLPVKLSKKPKDAYPACPKKVWTMKDKKTKTEEFIDKTSQMSLSEFTKYMLSECACEDMGDDDDSLPTVTSYAAGKFHPHPPEAIKYVVHLAKKNPRILDSLVHELKRADILPNAMGAGMEHPEGVDAIVDLLGDEENGPVHAHKLARLMNDKHSKFMDEQDDLYESVAPPYNPFSDNDDDEHDDSENGPSLDSHGMGPDEEDGAEDDGHDDSGLDDEMDHDDEDGEEPGNKEGPPDTDSEMQDKPDDSENHEKQPKKLKKKFAFHHMIDAMGEHKHMRDAMRSNHPD